MIDALTECDVQRVRRGHEVQRNHLKGIHDRERNPAERRAGRGIQRRHDRASPLQSEGGGDLLLGGKAKFLEPVSDFSCLGGLLGRERSNYLLVSQPSSSDHEQAERNAVRRRGGRSQGVELRQLCFQCRLLAFRLAIEDALQQGSGSGRKEARPWRFWTGTRQEPARTVGLLPASGPAVLPRKCFEYLLHVHSFRKEALNLGPE